MDLIEAVKARRSIRAYKSDPVPQDVLRQLIEVARWCPSWENVQPWELTVVGGDQMEELRRELAAVADADPAPEIPVQHFNDPYLSRRRNLGYRIVFDTLKIEREDRERRQWWRLQNQGMFGAPSAIFIYIDRSLNEWSVFDAGMIAQTLMLAAQHYGLGTIPQIGEPDRTQVAQVAVASLAEDRLALGEQDHQALRPPPDGGRERSRQQPGQFCKPPVEETGDTRRQRGQNVWHHGLGGGARCFYSTSKT